MTDQDETETSGISPPDQFADPIGWLIHRVTEYTTEQMQDGPVPMLERAAVLAILYNAKMTENLFNQLRGRRTEPILDTAQFQEAIRSFEYFAREPAPLHEYIEDQNEQNCYGCGLLESDPCHQISKAA